MLTTLGRKLTGDRARMHCVTGEEVARMEIIGRASIHPAVFFAGKVSGYVVVANYALSLFGAGAIPITEIAGLRSASLLFFGFGSLMVLASLAFLGRSTRLGLPKSRTVLKTRGIYRLSRNPMYAGFDLLSLAGMVGSLNAIIIALGLFSVATYHLIILAEERFLESRFGEEYSNYRLSVRRYL